MALFILTEVPKLCSVWFYGKLFFTKFKKINRSENKNVNRRSLICESSIKQTVLTEPRHENPEYVICEQQRRRSACASVQSDQCVIRCFDNIMPVVSISEISGL